MQENVLLPVAGEPQKKIPAEINYDDDIALKPFLTGKFRYSYLWYDYNMSIFRFNCENQF